MTVTAWPAPINLSTRVEPMKPAPPVTMMFMASPKGLPKYSVPWGAAIAKAP